MEMNICMGNCVYFFAITLAYGKPDCLDLGSIIKMLASKLSQGENLDY